MRTMIVFSLTAALVAVMPVVSTVQAGNDEWTNAGVYGGDANFVTYNPATDEVYSANRTQGLLRRGVDGLTWQAETANADLAIGRITVDSFDGMVLYRGDGDDLVLISTDGGATWSPSASGITSDTIGHIVASPSTAGVLYAGGSFGDMWRSNDGGATWTEAGNVGGTHGSGVTTIAVHPTDPDIVFGASAGGIFFTDDGGATWTRRQSGVMNDRADAIDFDPNDPSRVYLASRMAGFHIGHDLAAAGWTFTQSGHNAGYSLAVAPTNPTTIFYGSLVGVFVSTDAGGTFSAAAEGLTTLKTWSIAVDPDDASMVWAATEYGGVFRSLDGGGTFTEWNTGIETERVRALAVDARNPGRIWAATGDGVARTTDGGATWTTHRHMYWWQTPLYALGVSRSNPDDLYVYSNFMTRSEDGGDTMEVIHNSFCGPGVRDIAVHPTNPLVVYAAGLNAEICKTTNGGLSWFESTSGIPDGSSGNSVTLDPGNPDVLYVATGVDGIYRSENAGASWVQLPATDDTGVENVCIDRTDPNRVLAITDWVVYLSEDSGQTWIDISPPGNFMYQDCEFGPGGEMLVGSIGTNLVSGWGTFLHRSFDQGAGWEEFEGVPQGRVQDIRVDPFNHGRILVGLRGYGVAEYTDTSYLFNDGFETGDTSRWVE